MSDKVVIFDTTLRDGEQSPGISLDPGEKLEIAEQLARLGVDYIEAGFPVASQGDFEAVQAIARTVHGPVIAGLSRTQLADVDRCYEALRDADRSRIHVFISTSPSHMEHMLKMTEAQVLEEVRHGVARAREHTADVEFSPQDATRTPLDFMLEVLAAAVESGATTLNIPDTVGYGIPWDFGDLIAHVRAADRRRLRDLDPLPQRPRPRRGEQPVRGACRRPPGRGLRERARRACRQCRARGGGHGAQDPPGPVPWSRDWTSAPRSSPGRAGWSPA